MPKHLSKSQLLNLWKNSKSDSTASRLKLSSGDEDLFYKRALDNFCLKADLCEDLESYIHTVCDGMQELFDLGVTKRVFMNHSLALSKILRLGEDILEGARRESELFFIGLFVELKLTANWFKATFYKLVKQLLNKIVEENKHIPEALKLKIIQTLKKENYGLYALYFRKSPYIPLKKPA